MHAPLVRACTRRALAAATSAASAPQPPTVALSRTASPPKRAHVFNATTKDFARQLPSVARAAHTLKRQHAHFCLQRNVIIIFIVVFIKLHGRHELATRWHPNKHELANTRRHLFAAATSAPPQQQQTRVFRLVGAQPSETYFAPLLRQEVQTPDHQHHPPYSLYSSSSAHLQDNTLARRRRQARSSQDHHHHDSHHQPRKSAILKYHHNRPPPLHGGGGGNKSPATPIRKILPSGPPPFRPSGLMLGLNSLGALEKLRGTRVFKRMYKSKAYYLFLDVLEQLAGVLDSLARKRLQLAESQMIALQALARQLFAKGGHLLKLNWPLVMLNPNFIKEILSSPTLLVMLFHAIEVAYLSMPASFWLKPLVKLVRQPTPEKDEEVWWRRKRLYEVLNGPGSSELQPNLRTRHFRQPGEPAVISLAGYTQALRQLTGKPPPDPTYYSYPRAPSPGHQPPPPPPQAPHIPQAAAAASSSLETFMQKPQQQQPHQGMESYLTADHWPPPTAEAPPLATSSSPEAHYSAEIQQPDLAPEPAPLQPQLMSPSDFQQLEPHERALILEETRKSYLEARLADELIRQQSEFVDSIVHRQDGVLVPAPAPAGERAQVHGHGGGGELESGTGHAERHQEEWRPGLARADGGSRSQPLNAHS